MNHAPHDKNPVTQIIKNLAILARMQHGMKMVDLGACIRRIKDASGEMEKRIKELKSENKRVLDQLARTQGYYAEMEAVDEEAERYKRLVEGLTTANRRLEGRIKTLAAAFAKQVDMVDAHGDRLEALEAAAEKAGGYKLWVDADGNLI